jgi:glutamate transport system substrate-binding protein
MLRQLRIGACLAALVAATSACAAGTTEPESVVEVVANAQFPDGTMMARLSAEGSITIGVKYDQPGIGFLEPGASGPSGFDIEMGNYVAAQLGIPPENITWKETVSDNREPFLQNGTVDIVIASYSITPERSQQVGQAGPYYVTGQQLLVREEDKTRVTGPEDLRGLKVCSVTGSTSLERATQDYGAEPAPFDTFSACVRQLTNGTVDAVTTDGVILLGYEAQDPDNLEVVGPEFSEELLGIGYPKPELEMCGFLVDTIRKSIADGYWQRAFEATLGKTGIETPEPPNPHECAVTGK